MLPCVSCPNLSVFMAIASCFAPGFSTLFGSTRAKGTISARSYNRNRRTFSALISLSNTSGGGRFFKLEKGDVLYELQRDISKLYRKRSCEATGGGGIGKGGNDGSGGGGGSGSGGSWWDTNFNNDRNRLYRSILIPPLIGLMICLAFQAYCDHAFAKWKTLFDDMVLNPDFKDMKREEIGKIVDQKVGGIFLLRSYLSKKSN